MAQAQTELEAMEGVLDEYTTIVAEQTRRIRALEAALTHADNLLMRGDGVLYIAPRAWIELMNRLNLETTHNDIRDTATKPGPHG